jgi:putative sterol carrier protein
MNFEDVVHRFTAAHVQVPGKRVKIDFGAAGAIMLDGNAGQVTMENGPADATLELSFEDFAAMADGKLDPTSAFMQQKLKVTGDLSAAMELQGLLRGVRA